MTSQGPDLTTRVLATMVCGKVRLSMKVVGQAAGEDLEAKRKGDAPAEATPAAE